MSEELLACPNCGIVILKKLLFQHWTRENRYTCPVCKWDIYKEEDFIEIEESK